MTTTSFPAFRFDGRYAVAVPVLVRVEGAWLVIETLERREIVRERLAATLVSEPFDHAPRMVSMRGGVTLEMSDPDRAFAAALANAGLALPWAVRLQARWPSVLMALLAVVALATIAYTDGLPAAARWGAFALPARLDARMGRELLTVLDQHYLEPTGLDAARRAKVAAHFARAAAVGAPGLAYRLEFRRGRSSEVNAFALPGGIIVLLDGVVEFSDFIESEESVLGVLCHELGHVARRHLTQKLLRSIGVGALGGLLWGDFSGTAASVPIVIGELEYSREFEAEADDFAVQLLHKQKSSVLPLYRFFTCLGQTSSHRGADFIPRFLSTHPPTEQRLKRLRALETQPGGSDARCPPNVYSWMERTGARPGGGGGMSGGANRSPHRVR